MFAAVLAILSSEAVGLELADKAARMRNTILRVKQQILKQRQLQASLEGGRQLDQVDDGAIGTAAEQVGSQ